MRKPALVSFLLLALALAGCSGSDGDGGPGGPGGNGGGEAGATAAPPLVVRGTGTITASGPVLALGGEALAFMVAANVTLLHAEIAWDDPVQDIDLALASPGAGMTGAAQNFDMTAEGGAPGSPDSPHSLTVPSPADGEWRASAFANGAAANIEYRLAVTLFRGESDLPPGYTALA